MAKMKQGQANRIIALFGATCTVCSLKHGLPKDKRTDNRTILPTLKNNVAAGYQSRVKVKIFKGSRSTALFTCTAPQNEAASAIGSAAGEQPGAVNMILVGGLDTKSSIALMAAPLSH